MLTRVSASSWFCRYQNPVVDTDFPDPGVFYDRDHSTWYAYGTNSNGKNIQVASSQDFCSWRSHKEDALPGPHPPWTGVPGFNWAPEVVKAPGGRPGYLMYVSVKDRSTDKMSIGVAYSQQSPVGPFHFVSQGPLVSRVSIARTPSFRISGTDVHCFLGRNGRMYRPMPIH